MTVVERSDTRDARAVLARETADVHARLHRLPAFEALQAGTIARDAYRDLLLRLLGFHRPLEAGLAARADDLARFGLHFDALRRVARLEADLRVLDVDATSLAAAPAVAFDLAARPVGWLFGALYVREGATLGGRLLARRLDRVLGGAPHALAGRSFLAGTAHDGARWQAFCATLDRVAADEGMAAMIAGAEATFGLFERWTSEDPA